MAIGQTYFDDIVERAAGSPPPDASADQEIDTSAWEMEWEPSYASTLSVMASPPPSETPAYLQDIAARAFGGSYGDTSAAPTPARAPAPAQVFSSMPTQPAYVAPRTAYATTAPSSGAKPPWTMIAAAVGAVVAVGVVAMAMKKKRRR